MVWTWKTKGGTNWILITALYFRDFWEMENPEVGYYSVSQINSFAQNHDFPPNLFTACLQRAIKRQKGPCQKIVTTFKRSLKSVEFKTTVRLWDSEAHKCLPIISENKSITSIITPPPIIYCALNTRNTFLMHFHRLLRAGQVNSFEHI